MQSTLRLKLRPSWRLAGLLILLHAAALGALWALTFAPWIRLAVGATLVAGLVRALRRGALLLSDDAIVELGCKEDGHLDFVQRDGECFDADVLADTAVFGTAVLLRIRAAGQRRARSLVVMPDSADVEDFRRLRVWLRWRRPVSGAAGTS